MRDVKDLVAVVFSGLSPLVIQDVVDEGERILVRAQTPQGTVACPDCGADQQRELLTSLTAACPEMTALADLVRSFATLLTPAHHNAVLLTTWIATARGEDLPHLHAFTRGLDQDRHAVTAALTTSHHNGTTEGTNTKTKLLKRQMYGRAGFDLLRHRILLG